MKFHSLHLRMKGNAADPLGDDGRELDIADEFALLSRSLGLEGAPDTYAGLWSTQPVYNDYSLLKGDFLTNGLHLDLICDVEYPVPFSALFLCLGETLRRKARCDITEVSITCKPYSVGKKIKRRRSTVDLRHFSHLNSKPHPLPVARCSAIHFTLDDKRNSLVSTGTLATAMSPCYLSELALPISGIWSSWEDSLRHVETIQIMAS